MATKRSTFQKRQRETDLKDKAREKDARRAAKRGQTTPEGEAAAQAAERAQEAEITAAIAAVTAASATIAHDARRAAQALPSVTYDMNPAVPEPAPPVDQNPRNRQPVDNDSDSDSDSDRTPS